MSKSETWDYQAYWYFGGIASAGASALTHPLDLVRAYMQAHLKKISATEIVRLILKTQGWPGFCYELNSTVTRQLIFSVQRFGIFEIAKQRGWTESFWQKALIAGGSGIIAGFTNSPMDMVNIQMRMDTIRPQHTRRNYRGYMDGFMRLYERGGIQDVFRGAPLSAFRGMVLTVGQVSVYHQIKDKFNEIPEFVDKWEVYFFASFVAGGITSVLALPLDVINTISKNAEIGDFSNDWEVMQRIYRENGFKGFFKGVIPSSLRFVPTTILTFFFYEELRLHFGKRIN